MSNYRFISFETIAGTVHYADIPRKSSDKTYGEKLISLFARREEEKVIIGVLFDIGIEYDVIFSPLFASGDE